VQELRDRIVQIQNYRTAQIADGRKYQTQINKLAFALNQMLRRGARNLLTPQEQALLDKQQHVEFSEMSEGEKGKLQGEIDSMWGQIPAHLQEKARRLAGVN
jgi:hypothetical protein